MNDLTTNPMSDYLNLSVLAKQYGGPKALLEFIYKLGKNESQETIMQLTLENASLRKQVNFYKGAFYTLGGTVLVAGLIYRGVKHHNKMKKQKQLACSDNK